MRTDLQTQTQLQTSFSGPELEALTEWWAALARRADDTTLVVQARKAYCLTQTLQADVGADVPSRTMISEKALPFLAESEERVFQIADDVMVGGTTLEKTYEQASQKGAVEGFSVAIAREQSKVSIRGTQVTAHRLFSDQECRAFLVNSVKTMMSFSRPYLCDYPTLPTFSVSDRALERLKRMPLWEFVDVTTPWQEYYDTQPQAFSLIPEPSIAYSLAETDNLLAAIDGAKVRVFVRREGSRTRVQVVPIVLLGPINRALTDRVVSDLTRSAIDAQTQDVLQSKMMTPSVVHRLVQYSLSVRLGDLFLGQLSTVPGFSQSHLTTLTDTEAVHHYGPLIAPQLPWMARRVRETLQTPSRTIRAQAVNVGADLIERHTPTRAQPEQTIGDVASSLATTFYRQFLEETRIHQQRLPGIIEATPRGGEGVAWTEISRRMRERTDLRGHGASWKLTCALDQLNDLGIAVPVYRTTSNTVTRLFRYGEDVQFGEGEFELAREVLASVQQCQPHLTSLLIEKTLVLMIKCGTSGRWLDLVHGNPNAVASAGIRPSLHGNTVETGSQRHSFLSSENSRLFDELLSRGILTEADGDFSVSTQEHSPIGNDRRTSARLLGILVGNLYHASIPLEFDGSEDTRWTDDDLVIITSTWPSRNAYSCLVAEVDLIQRWLRSRDYAKLRHSGTSHNLRRDGVAVVALFSAEKKLRWHKSRAFESTIRKARQHLAAMPNPQMASMLEPVLSEIDRFSEIETPQAVAAIDGNLGEISQWLSLTARHFIDIGRVGGRLEQDLRRAEDFFNTTTTVEQ